VGQIIFKDCPWQVIMTGGKNYCRRCEVYYSNQSKFYPCCGMAL